MTKPLAVCPNSNNLTNYLLSKKTTVTKINNMP